MLLTLFIIPIISLIILGSIWVSTNKNITKELYSTNFLSYRFSVYQLIKLVTLLSLFITLFYEIYLWKNFPQSLNNLLLYPSALQFGDITLFEITNNLNLPFIILSTFVLIIAVLTAWYSNVNMLLFCSMMLLLEIFLVGAFSCVNLFVFLLFFEASALPIFILIAYCGSPRRERIKASYYFIFFTFYGSLSLLLLILNFYSLTQISFNTEIVSQSTNGTLWLLLFIAFAVKIPLFPFHIWLPYAHVEASTPTSILLAALMLKLGGYGVIKFMLPFFTIQTHIEYQWIGLSLCIIGCIYASFAALRQIDLKRNIAFSSVAHMSFATAGIFSFTEIGIKGSIYLMLSHGFTSTALFFLIGVLSDRYHTRSIMAFSGLLATMPLFSFFLIVMSLANVGFPGTSGFLPEIMVLIGAISSLNSFTQLGLYIFILGMLLTTASTLIVLLRLLFGHLKTIYTKSSWIDLTKLEFFILAILTVFVIVLGFYDILN